MVLVKKLKISHRFLLGLIGQENVFHDVLERKQCFSSEKKSFSKLEKQIVKQIEKLGFFQRG